MYSRSVDRADFPAVTIVVTCFNHAANISLVLESICRASSLFFDLHIIDDCSEDETLKKVTEFAVCTSSPYLTGVRISEAITSQFETTCDDYGLRAARTKYVILTQGDIQIDESGYDSRLLKPLQRFADVMGVSGRGTEPLQPIHEWYIRSNGSVASLGNMLARILKRPLLCRAVLKYPFLTLVATLISVVELRLHALAKKCSSPDRDLVRDTVERFPGQDDFSARGSAGFLDLSFSKTVYPDCLSNRFWQGQTVMRGPLALDRDKYLEIGGFDTKNMFLGFDDHDLFLRGFTNKGYRVGFFPIAVSCDPTWGATRKTRSFKQTHLLMRRLARVGASRYRAASLAKNLQAHPEPQIRIV